MIHLAWQQLTRDEVNTFLCTWSMHRSVVQVFALTRRERLDGCIVRVMYSDSSALSHCGRVSVCGPRSCTYNSARGVVPFSVDIRLQMEELCVCAMHCQAHQNGSLYKDTVSHQINIVSHETDVVFSTGTSELLRRSALDP